MLPLVYHGSICSTCVFFSPFPDSSALYVQNLFPIGPVVWPHFPVFFNYWLPKNPKFRRGVSWGELFLAYVHSQMNPQTCTKIGSKRSSRVADFPDLNLWPPKTLRNAPCDIEGRVVFSYVHSQTNPQIWRHCTKFGSNRSNSLRASQDIWICDPQNPQNDLLCIVGRLVFSLCPFPDESADANHSWCQSVSRLTASPDF